MKEMGSALIEMADNMCVQDRARTNTHVAVLGKETKDSLRIDIVAVTGCECRKIDGVDIWGLTCLNFDTQETGWYTGGKIMGFKLGDRVSLSGLDFYLFDDDRSMFISVETRVKLYEYVLTKLTEMPQ